MTHTPLELASIERIAHVSQHRDQVDREVGEARLRWYRDRTEESFARWREALSRQRKADEEYWEVTAAFL
jgi:hypothetical protein